MRSFIILKKTEEWGKFGLHSEKLHSSYFPLDIIKAIKQRRVGNMGET
jgi:hypothetical protein